MCYKVIAFSLARPRDEARDLGTLSHIDSYRFAWFWRVLAVGHDIIMADVRVTGSFHKTAYRCTYVETMAP